MTDSSFVYGCRRVQRERESRAREGDYMKRKGELLDVRTESYSLIGVYDYMA